MSEQGKLPAPSSKSAVATETMPSTSKSGSNLTRIQRNVAEKQRRDKLNGYISELANIVPMVSMSSKRLDKTSILRLSAAHLRLSKSPLSGSKKLKKSFKWCPSFLTAQQVREILESVDGFLIVTSSSGKILFTSSSVERYLGHQNIDMIGHSLFVFIHPEDLDSVKAEMERLLAASLKCGDSGPAPRCSFRCRMKEKGQPRSEVATYQFVHFAGDMTISDEEDGASKNIKSTAIVTHIFKAFVRIVDANPYCQLSLEDATADEYVTRHSLDGTIIFADHRLSTITGHLPQEVIGLSAYKYILPEDISIALFAHHLMFSSDKGTGMIVYRLRTQDDKFVYLKSVGCLQFDRATSQVDHFVCVNQHLSDAEGEAQLKYFVDRFIPHIRDSSALTLFESVKALQVMGVKAPSSIGGINENITFSKFSAPDSKVLKSNSSNENGHKNKSSKDAITNSSVLFSSDKSTENPNVVVSKSAELSQVSSLKKASSDKNIGTEISISSASKQNQCKNKNSSYSEADSGSRKKKATSNIPTNVAQSDIKPLVSNTNSSSASDRTIPITDLHPVQNGISTGKLPSSNKTLIAHLSVHNVSIKKELLGSSDAENGAFSIGKERKERKNPNAGFTAGCQEVVEHSSSQTMKKSNCVQVHISAVSVSNSKDSSFHVLPQNGEIIHSDLQTSVSKGYDTKVHAEFTTSNTANMNRMKEENFPGVKSNILLSTGSIMFKNDFQQKVPTPVTGDTSEFVRLEKDTISGNKVNSADSNHLSANVNDVVIETNLWPGETSSESSASNAVSEEAFVSPMECSGEDYNLYFMPEEEMKDYLDGSDDISSILNSTLPFDDSSLPSVDGWSEYLRPEDVLSTSNELHADGEQPLINTFGEKSFDLW